MPKNKNRNNNNQFPFGVILTKKAVESFENNIVAQENYLEKSGALNNPNPNKDLQ